MVGVSKGRFKKNKKWNFPFRGGGRTFSFEKYGIFLVAPLVF